MRGRVTTFAVGLVGVAAFVSAGLPLPFLLGPLFACLVAALSGVRMAGPGLLGTSMRTILGVAVGSSITPDVVGRLPDMALSVALVPVFVIAVGALGYPFFRKMCGFDHATSYYAAMPGGLQDMLVFGEEAGADVRALSLIHATRVLVIVTTIPFLLAWTRDIGLDNPPGAPAAELPASELLLMCLAALGGWYLARKVGLFGASILGPLIASAALSLTGMIHSRPPAEAIIAAQFFIGISVGVKYTGITMRELRIDVSAGLGYCLILAAISFVFAEIVILGGLAPPLDALLAFAPGGQAEMALLAILVGADLAYVVTLHLVRISTVIVGAPIVRHMLERGKSGK